MADSDNPSVGIIMGSQSDWPTMQKAAEILDELGVTYDAKIVSAHRTPDRLWDYGVNAADRGIKVIIAGAGGAAHLPGMVASKTHIPVVGVPVQTRALSGV
ncbi:MAG: 5-(carboxyamino)imidazole ribonucleotide mutase, partial [Paracoccaceae bacterium]